jgi:ribosome-associated heat shock protein Hsp15
MEKVRIDKWLWAVRIFKSRTLAADAAKEGKVRINDQPVKASSLVGTSDRVTVKKDGFNLTFKVLQPLEKRVGAPIAQTCYENQTPESELNKYKTWYLSETVSEFREKGSGRPTKRDRREIDEFKESAWWDDETD